MKFGKHLDQCARPDWAVNYVNYKRVKDQIKIHAEISAFQAFIQEECEKVEKFYMIKLQKAKTDGEKLNHMMEESGANKQGSVASMVKLSWNHTEDLRNLCDFCLLNSEGIRKSLKKYDKAFKDDGQPELKGEFLSALKSKYSFFAFRDDLCELVQQVLQSDK